MLFYTLKSLLIQAAVYHVMTTVPYDFKCDLLIRAIKHLRFFIITFET